ncbi:unnamed protein product [Mytilus edulis]|uniref:Ig-like domain-containing protein n=1 Tax=Mytilus edulis TaxID=6550 RepID=A0A8S3UFG4_MYTED|nr:unnamed protein product [Mytilus edulis]
MFKGDAACLDCKGVSQPEDCPVVTRCGPHEQCSVEEYVTNDGNALYDVGCKDIQRCNLNGFGRRQANTTTSIKREIGTVVCSECCNSRLFPLCNIAGCGIKKPILPVGSKICYKCPSSIHPDECTQLTLCNKNQSCSSQSNSASSTCSNCCDMDVCNDNCNKSTVTTTTLKPSPSPTKSLTSRSTTSKILSTSTQASTMPPTVTTLTPKTTTISTLKTTANPTPSTTMSTLKMTAIPTAQSTTMSNKTMTTIVTRRTTTAQRLSSTIDTTTRLKSTTKNQATLSSPIIIDVNRNPQVVHFGDKVNIRCTAIGYPPPIYNFKFKDGPLPNNARATGNTLTILNFVSTNVGNYECIATNSEGTGNYGIHLQAFL